MESMSISEMKVLANHPEAGKKIEAVMTNLWQTQLQVQIHLLIHCARGHCFQALWAFASEGDPIALVSACRQLIGWQDEDGNK